MNDTYQTIESISEGQITEKRSKFRAFAHPVVSPEQAKAIVDEYRKQFYDARHVCWAYIIGAQSELSRANDDGEPSGTAGKPILGQIKSHELTNILILVVRYFGGIKLGTSGLIVAYREAAANAIENATIVQKTDDGLLSFSYEYEMMNSVMRIIKEFEPQIISQAYDNNCLMTLQIRKGLLGQLQQKLEKVETLRFADT